jgi:peptide/nickel transport system ATP-binding protein
MRDGAMVEQGPVARIFDAPAMDYTRTLLAAVPRIGSGAGRRESRAPDGAEPVASVNDLRVRFDLRDGLLGRVRRRVHAVEGISFDIRPNETLALVGESGCGKSTTAKALAGLVPYAGSIRVGGRDLAGLDGKQRQAVRRDVQMVFQDPFASLDPRMRVGDLVAEPLIIHKVAGKRECRDRVAALFERVGLPADAMERYPHEFSGGQRQRICIARALALQPKLVIADESVSALDVSVQARVLELLRELQSELGVAYLFISHDMAVVEHLCDDIAVMYLGQIVERAPRQAFFTRALHPYSVALMSAVPTVGGGRARAAQRIRLSGDPPSPISPPPGCRFAGRCPVAEPACVQGLPELREVEPGHWVRCRRIAAQDGVAQPILRLPE